MEEVSVRVKPSAEFAAGPISIFYTAWHGSNPHANINIYRCFIAPLRYDVTLLNKWERKNEEREHAKSEKYTRGLIWRI